LPENSGEVLTMMMLEGKRAIVTGGSMGIGASIAKVLARQGADVAINYRKHDTEAKQVVAEIESLGRKGLAIKADVANFADAQRMVDEVKEKFGGLDILVNNAGINRDALAVKITESEVTLMGDDRWDPVLDVNLKGTFLCAQAAAVPMIRQKYGRIVNTSSIGALGNVGQANYSASKAGVIGLTKTLALEWARFNILVNCVAPGATETRMTAGIPDNLRQALVEKIPLRRLAQPEEIAAAHLFLASDDAGYITGQVLFVDGGISVGV